jgi:hypothetical protein
MRQHLPLLLGAILLGAACVLAVALSAPPEAMQVSAADPRLQRDGLRWLLQGQPYSGDLVESAPDGGRSVRPLRAGLLQGTVRSWYADGRLRSERLYEAGRKNGPQREWWPDGQPRLAAIMLADAPVGTLRSWYQEGLPYEEHRYDAGGHESGLQRVWYQDGTARANYIVAGGRRYGTIGPRGCLGKAPPVRP